MSEILITGIPRSGTSLVAGLINLAANVSMGQTAPGNENNEKGFFENTEFKNKIIKPLLTRATGDRWGQYKLPDTSKLPHVHLELLRKAFYHMTGSAEHRAFKDPKLLLLWPIFVGAFPKARWVIVRRDRQSIIDSMDRTWFMQAHEGKGWTEFLSYHVEEMGKLERNANVHTIWADTLITCDPQYDPLSELEQFLGIDVPRDQAEEFITPALWKH